MSNNRRIIDYWLFVEAWLFLALARFALVFIPFKRIVPVMGTVQNAVYTGSKATNNVLFSAISLAILRGARYSPWRTMCFEQALAAKLMLKRRGFANTIFFGVHKAIGTDKLTAHAWLECEEMIITGGKNLDRYTVIAVFKG